METAPHSTVQFFRTKAAAKWLLFVLALAVHVGLVLREFPLSALRGGEPPLKGDVSRYFATANGAAKVSGLYGYDPYFMAGYPVGLWNSMGKKGFELSVRLLPGLSLPQAVWLVLNAVAVLGPLVLWIGLRRFLTPGPERVALFALALVYWHLDTMTAYFWGFGNVFFPAMSALLVVVCASAWDLLDQRASLWRGVLTGVGVAILFYCHTVLLVGAVPPLLWAVIVRRRALAQWRTWMALAAACAVAAVLCLPWLLPLLSSAADCIPQPKSWLQSSWRHWAMDTFSDRGYLHHFDRNLLLRVAVIFGLAGAYLARGRRPVLTLCGVGALSSLVIAYSGSYLGPVRAMQPYRFLIPSVMFLLPPAAMAAIWFAGRVRAMDRASRSVVALLALVLAPAFTAYLIDLARPRLFCGLPGAEREAIRLVARSGVKGRLLCDDMQIGHMIPYFCGVPVLGGLSAQSFVRHSYAGVEDNGRVFGRPVQEWEPAELKTRLDAYAVDTVLLRQTAWLSYAEGHADLFEPAGRSGAYRLYRVRDAKPSLVREGGGRARADFDRIAVDEVSAGRLVLKLHYEPWLEADAGVTLRPVRVLDDPVPFIECSVPAGVSSFTITKRKG